MRPEDKIPETFKSVAFHPSLYEYAWKRKDLEKLFDELMKSNISVVGGQVWTVDNNNISSLIALKTGDIDVFSWKIDRQDDEQWFDFVERSTKETLSIINYWDLEKNVQPDMASNIYYNFTFAQN